MTRVVIGICWEHAEGKDGAKELDEYISGNNGREASHTGTGRRGGKEGESAAHSMGGPTRADRRSDRGAMGTLSSLASMVPDPSVSKRSKASLRGGRGRASLASRQHLVQDELPASH